VVSSAAAAANASQVVAPQAGVEVGHDVLGERGDEVGEVLHGAVPHQPREEADLRLEHGGLVAGPEGGHQAGLRLGVGADVADVDAHLVLGGMVGVDELDDGLLDALHRVPEGDRGLG